MGALLAIVLILFVQLESYADIYKHVSDDGIVSFTNAPLDRNSKVAIKEEKITQTAKKENNKSFANKDAYRNVAKEKAIKHNMDPQLVKAVITAESNWNPYAVSKKGALGLMQLIPATASLMGVKNPFNPDENIDGGIRYLKHLLEKFNGNITLALAAYNAGPGRVEKTKTVPAIPETVTYVKRVMDYYLRNKEISAVEDSKEIKGSDYKIQKLVLEDGTILFTNSYVFNSEQGF